MKRSSAGLLLAASSSQKSPAPPALDTRDVVVPGPHGSVRVRVYRPASIRVEGGLVWVHGGGFAWGDIDHPEADVFSREVAARSGATVISVDYRLARDGIRFPIPHDDVFAAWTWTVGDSGLAATRARWRLGGASAGPNLAVGVALRARDDRSRPPDGLVLAYPFVHADLLDPGEELAAALAEMPPALRFYRPGLASMRDNYIGDSPGCAPLRHTRRRGSPRPADSADPRVRVRRSSA